VQRKGDLIVLQSTNGVGSCEVKEGGRPRRAADHAPRRSDTIVCNPTNIQIWCNRTVQSLFQFFGGGRLETACFGRGGRGQMVVSGVRR
jgi:hypothetical protein